MGSNVPMRIVHRLLLCLPPELAHHIGIFFLRLAQKLRVPLSRSTPSKCTAIHLSTPNEIAFKSRLGLAAGFDKNAEAFVALSQLGFGFIEVGTVTPKPQMGNPKPRIWRISDRGLRNQLGFNNVGLDRFEENLRTLRPRTSVPLFANIGKNKTTRNTEAAPEYQRMETRLQPYVDGFVINVSSPNTPGLRDLQSTAFLETLSSQLSFTRPVFVKFAPDLEDEALKELCRFVAGSPLSGVVLTNTSRELAKKLTGADSGGYSGHQLLERSTHCVAAAKQMLGKAKAIIGVGGVDSVESAHKMRAAGADLVEIYTGFVYGGPRLVQTLSTALRD